jgi:uncharacterized repeat protein (TIGR01451 family)
MSFRQTVGFWLLVGLVSSPGPARADDDPITDPNVEPAQYARPVALTQLPDAAPPPGAVAPDPPTPVVRLHIAAPSHVAPHKDVPYKITVQNASAARAYSVRVRNPKPPRADFVKADPPPSKQSPGEWSWQLGNLGPGESKTIELTLKPAQGAGEVDNKAFVSFEHGQEVDTRVDKPKLAVRKAAPKQAVGGDPIRVQVEVTNNSKVAVSNVRLVEDVSAGFRYTADGDAERGKTDGQRVWNIGTLRPGERKLVEYRLASAGGGDLVAQSAVSGEHLEPELAESKTKVVVPGIKLDLTGSPGAQPGVAAKYEAVITNTGTMPLTNVRVAAAVPADCKVIRVTNGGQMTRDGIAWTVPDKEGGPLRPGETCSVRFELKSATSGQRTVRVAADAGHGVEQAKEATTAFQAAALLTWKAELDRSSVPANREGFLTVRVTNTGGESARNTRLTILLPGGLNVEEGSPRQYDVQAGSINFAPITIPPGRTETYSLTFTARKPGPAHFTLKLASEYLGDYPLIKELDVQVTPAPGGRDPAGRSRP